MLHAAECWDGLAPCRYGCRPTGPVNAGSVARTQLGVRKASCLVVFTSMSPSTRIYCTQFPSTVPLCVMDKAGLQALMQHLGLMQRAAWICDAWAAGTRAPSDGQ